MQHKKLKEMVNYLQYGEDTWLLPHLEDFDGDLDEEINSLARGYEDFIKHSREK
jgi:hypothetical protein